MTANTDGTGLWVRRFQPAADAAYRLVCLPHAGGSASFYLPVSRALSPESDVLAVQYPGRQDRRKETPIDNIPGLADAVYEALLPWLDRPFALFGHSMGATLAYEVARRAEERGQAVTALFVSGRRAPSRHRDESVHQLGKAGLLAELKRLAGTDAQILGDDEMLQMILPAIRSDYKAIETYRYQPGPALRAPIHAHVGLADPRVTLEEAEAWREHTSAAFTLSTYPGGHFYLNDQAPKLIDAIRQVMSGASLAG
ncbi:alpha/beta fold hydrolase [Microtetraspora sp. NBRC 16547]|uniref:thioesterase II family protein n=1 Tax=Microtetraspora sp. NBRC 16547 TaxID=3030993 RepID=UPI0024A378E0|nr:alpha/beta fold hydrolase [Microtetraspora sp. NBRC 16547]GLW99277.1 oleoyl-ACP hydrolase [Microtetraspora sp. NBRC 16547]